MKMKEKLEVFKPTQVVVKNFLLEDQIKDNLKKLLEENFSDEYEIRFSKLKVMLMPKKRKEIFDKLSKKSKEADEKTKKEGKKPIQKIILDVNIRMEDITFFHRDEDDYNDKRIIVDSSDENILKKIIGK